MGANSGKVKITPIPVDDERNSQLCNGLVSLNRDVLMKLVKIIRHGKKIRIVFGMTEEFYQWSKLPIFRHMRYGESHWVDKRFETIGPPPPPPERNGSTTLWVSKGQTVKAALAGRSNTSIRAIGGVLPPPSPTKFGDRYFYLELPNIEYADLRETGWTEIGEGWFHHLSKLKRVEFPPELECIHKLAFGGVEKLTNVWFPERLRCLGDYAFALCNGLKEIVLPPRFEKIGQGCFQCCKSLRRMEFPPVMMHIGSSVFDYCTALHTLEVGDVENWETSTSFSTSVLGEDLKLKEVHLTGRRWETIPAGLSNCLSQNARIVGPNFVGHELGGWFIAR